MPVASARRPIAVISAPLPYDVINHVHAGPVAQMCPRFPVSDVADVPGRVSKYRCEQEDQDCKYGPPAINVLSIHLHFASFVINLGLV